MLSISKFSVTSTKGPRLDSKVIHRLIAIILFLLIIFPVFKISNMHMFFINFFKRFLINWGPSLNCKIIPALQHFGTLIH